MTEFQLKTNPFASSMTTGCSVLMTSDRVVRRDRCYDGSNTDDDEDDDVMHMDDSGSVDSKASNGQWVRLSKSLLLQLVERICMLSFQQAENQCQSSTTQVCRDDLDCEQPNAMNKRRGMSSSPDDVASTPEVRSNHVIASSPGETGEAAAETMLVESTNEKASCLRTSPSKPSRDADRSSPIKLSSKRRCLVRTGAAAQNAMSGGVVGRGVNDDVSNGKSHRDREQAAGDGSNEEVTLACDEKNFDAPATDAVSGGSNAVNKSCSLARRRHRLNAANVLRRHRQRSRRRRSQISRRSVSGGSADGAGAHRGLLKRPAHQTWLALNKSLVLCALDRALSMEDASSAANLSTSGGSSRCGGSGGRVAKSIWNPATSLSRYEARAAKSASEQELPVSASCFSSPMWMTHPCSDPRILACTEAASLAASYSFTNSSLLCALLGFDAGSSATADDVTNTSSAAPPAHVTHHRTPLAVVARGETNENVVVGKSCQRREDEADMNSTSMSPECSVAFSSFDVDTAAKSPETNWPLKMTSPPRLIVGTPSSYRATKQLRAGLMDDLKPGCTGDKWIVLDKGDVYSLVESLVNTMIASGTPGDRRRIAPSGAAAEHSASKEPRKWKSNLLQRLRTETQ